MVVPPPDSEAVPNPPFIARRIPRTFPTVAPTPAPTEPRRGAEGDAVPAASYPIAAPGRKAASPYPRS